LPSLHPIPHFVSNPRISDDVSQRENPVASAILAVLISPAAHAAGLLPFDAVRFEEARQSGKPVVLRVTASWCGPCQRLRKVVGGLLENPEFKDLVIFGSHGDDPGDLSK
jgi:thioredoxin 1